MHFHIRPTALALISISTLFLALPLPLVPGIHNNSRALASGTVYPPPVNVTQQYWGTFYYPWYGNNYTTPSSEGWRHWNGCPCPSPYNASSPPYHAPDVWRSHYLPDDGSHTYNNSSQLYSSMDPTVLDRHLSQMNYAGFNFTLVSWWGNGTYEDRAFKLILQRAVASGSHVKLAVLFEPEGYSDPNVTQIKGNLSYVWKNYSTSPAYFTIDNKPVVFVYADSNDKINYTLRWATARAQLYAMSEPEPFFIGLKVWNTSSISWKDYANDTDTWYQYGPKLAYELQPGQSAYVSPGFWEYPPLPNETMPSANLTRSPRAFVDAVAKMKTLNLNQAKFLFVETFNEFHEGSQIEPAFRISGNSSSYDRTYLNAIRCRGCFSGDVDGNFGVDIVDLATVAIVFGSVLGKAGFKATADLNGDEHIDIVDLVIVASNFGKYWP